MTVWTPSYKILINGTDATNLTLVGFTITSGRTNINTQPQAGYANLQIINKNNSNFDWNVNTAITVEVLDTTSNWIPIFGGRISDVTTLVKTASSIGYVTQINIIALGALSKLSKAVWIYSLSQAKDGDQIYTILGDLLSNNWNEVSPAVTWNTYDATQTWTDAENVGLGEIDRPGQYEMEQRSASSIDFYTIVSQIANSALGYIYEDAYGNVSYADATHRQNYLISNGYVEFDANQAIASGLRQSIRSGSIVNKYQINYGNNFGSSKTAEDTTSQALYGQYAVSDNSYLHDATDAQNVVNRYIALRAYPRPQFESITFPLQNPEMSDSNRNALLAIFMGQPIKVINLPSNIYGGEFTGYVEGWTFTSTLNGLSINLSVSPTEFSAASQTWGQVNAAERWNTINVALQWEDAIGVIS